MTEIEIAIGKSKYKINCQESEKANLQKLAVKLNERVNRLSFAFRNLDEKTLLAISALVIEEELEEAQKHSKPSEAKFSEVSEQDVFDAVSENMENISNYLERLTKKILSN